MAKAKIIEATAEILAPEASKKYEIAELDPPRIPYHQDVTDRFHVDRGGWRVLCDSVFPSAQSFDAIVMALSYCKVRGLDVFKRPVHIVPMWSSAAGRMIETVWPSISELRTTAFRTGQYAGMEEPEFGPVIERIFKGKSSRGASKGKERTVTLKYPEWCRITILRTLNGQERRFVGPKVYWTEAYAKWSDTDVPNDMWTQRTVGQHEKCAEAAALRRAFPEEIGNDPTAEEMEGQRLHDVDATPRKENPVRDEAPPAPPPADAPDAKTVEVVAPFAPWLRELEGALSGCEEVAELVEKQEGVMNPMKDKVPPEIWTQAEKLLSDHFARIAADDQTEESDSAPPFPGDEPTLL